MDVEDTLGDDRAAHEGAEVAADERGDGDEGVTQDVARHDDAAGEALGARGAHVVGGNVFGDGLAGQSDDVGQGDAAEHHGRHGEAPEVDGG